MYLNIILTLNTLIIGFFAFCCYYLIFIDPKSYKPLSNCNCDDDEIYNDYSYDTDLDDEVEDSTPEPVKTVRCCRTFEFPHAQ